MNGAEFIVRSLEKAGVTHAFGIAGHGNLPILDAFIDSGIRYISTAHEQVAVHAADAFYRVSGRPAVVVTSVGPGLTNTLTALGDALLDSSAVIVIAGDVPTDYVGRGALQEVMVLGDGDNATPFRSFCKRVVKPAHPSRVPDALAEAYAYAMTGCPGPVLLDLPLDLQVHQVADDVVDLAARTAGAQAVRPDAATVDLAVRALLSARRPVVYAGGGVRSDRALSTLRVLVDSYGIPVATTMSGQGAIPGDHPLCLGMTGVVGCRPANECLAEADLVLALGTRFPDMDTSSWSAQLFATFPPARLIHVDIEGTQIGRVYPVTVGVVADVGAFLDDFLDVLSAHHADSAHWREWSDSKTAAIAKWRSELAKAEENTDVPFSPQLVVRTLRDALPPDAVLVSGVGIRHTLAQHYACQTPRRLIVGSGFGTMGQEPPAVIGAKLAVDSAPVVGAIGDGSLLASLACLPTAAQYAIPALWIVLNNGGYSSINIYQMKHYERSLGTMFQTDGGSPYRPDFVRIAKGFGLDAERVTTVDQLASGIRQARTLTAPLLLDVPVTDRPSLNSSGFWPINDLFATDAAARVRGSEISVKG